jgi:hypothetical protein
MVIFVLIVLITFDHFVSLIMENVLMSLHGGGGVCFVVFVSSVSGPAHILCLTVASGWNKERCVL